MIPRNKIKLLVLALINFTVFQARSQVIISNKDSINSIVEFMHIGDNVKIDSLICKNYVDSISITKMFDINVHEGKYYELYYNISGFPQYFDWYDLGEKKIVDKRGFLTIKAISKMGSISINRKKIKYTLTSNNFGISKVIFQNDFKGNYFDKWFKRKIDFYLNFSLIDRSGRYPSLYDTNTYVDLLIISEKEEYNTILMLTFWSEPSDDPSNLTMIRNIFLDPILQEARSCEILSPIQ